MTDNPSQQGCVVLVGAGPGDPGLITVKGRDWLRQAEVVVYDHLASARLLEEVPAKAEIIYAGKKAGVATLQQSEINSLLIDRARSGKIVVRLKGGDPFIFGRGGEEAIAMQEAGIPLLVVPGIPSPMGVSAYAGIPLTHRDCSSSISIVTGSNEKGKEDLHIDWEKIASRSGTLVFLMGARKLQRIAENLMKYGKNPDTPIAVIQWGTLPQQKTWTGTLATITEIAKREKIQPPALTIVGEVVDLKPHMDWFESQPLFGKTVVITRAGDQADGFSRSLLERGAEPFLFPVIQTVEPNDPTPLNEAVQNMDRYHGVIFTSSNGVRWFLHRLEALELDIRVLKDKRLYCIGPKTAEALQARGVRPDLIPEEYVAESLIESLGSEGVAGKHFLIPRAEVAREVLPDELRQQGAEVDVCPAYRTIRPDTDPASLRTQLAAGEIDAVTFTSSSTVTHFMGIVGHDAASLLGKTAVICIGPVTAKTAEKSGLKVSAMAETFTVQGLIQALERYFAKP